MKKIIIIIILILQILFTCIIFVYNPPIIIAINDEEFNELLMTNTYFGFPKSFFILATLKENWFRPESCEIFIINEYSSYTLKRGSEDVVKYYIKNNANFRIILIVFNLVLDFIIIIIIHYLKKSKFV